MELIHFFQHSRTSVIWCGPLVFVKGMKECGFLIDDIKRLAGHIIQCCWWLHNKPRRITRLNPIFAFFSTRLQSYIKHCKVMIQCLFNY